MPSQRRTRAARMPPPLVLGLILAVCVRLAAGDTNNCPDFVSSFNQLRARHGVPPLVAVGNLDSPYLSAARTMVYEGVVGEEYDENTSHTSCTHFLYSGDAPKEVPCNWGPGSSCPSIVWQCADSFDCDIYLKQDPCQAAIKQWTSYTWVPSDTPLDANPKGQEYAQIVWKEATQVACATQLTAEAFRENPGDTVGCVYVICVFDKGVELTNAAYKENVKPLGPPLPSPSPSPPPLVDAYSWCSLFATNQQYCNEKHIQCDGGPIASCCPASCAKPAAQPS